MNIIKHLLSILIIVACFPGCGAIQARAQVLELTANSIIADNGTKTPLESPLLEKSKTSTPFPTITKTQTPLPSETPVPSFTPEASVTPTSTWFWNPAGIVIAPILLYHHVANLKSPNLYNVNPDNFRKQMVTLKSLGYSAIPVSLLVQVIKEGGDLPPRPVVITFDDGYEDVYENAYPILKELGFSANLYLIAKYLDQPGYLTKDQILEMQNAGWEFGSHSLTHSHLKTLSSGSLVNEVDHSRQVLIDELQLPITTFAYPYGERNDFVVQIVQQQYQAAQGLGESNEHSSDTLFFLSRREVGSKTDMRKFLSYLPWVDPLTTQ